MPRNYRKKTAKPRRRRYRRRPGNAIMNRSNRIGADPFPAVLFAKLSYVARFKLTPTIANTLTFHNFCANGLFDPDLSAGGHQPMGFDQYMTMYNHYEVIGSKAVVDFMEEPTATSAQNNVIVGVHVNDDIVPHSSNLSALMENGKASYRFLTDQQMKAKAIMKWSEKKSLGKHIVGNSEVKGTVASNPSEQQVFCVFTQAIEPTTVGCPVVVTARITYIAKFTERKDMVQS